MIIPNNTKQRTHGFIDAPNPFDKSKADRSPPEVVKPDRVSIQQALTNTDDYIKI